MKSTLLALAALFWPLLYLQSGQDSKFNVTGLSENGLRAYQKLMSAKVFAIGPVGWTAQTSDEELALRRLLSERKAAEALTSLITEASPEGSLYGLLGLRLTDASAFEREVKNYKAQPETPERAWGLPSRLKVPRGHVVIQRGCNVGSERREKVVGAIEAGDYDGEF